MRRSFSSPCFPCSCARCRRRWASKVLPPWVSSRWNSIPSAAASPVIRSCIRAACSSLIPYLRARCSSVGPRRTPQRFLRYVRVDTQSDHFSETRPSTERQLELSRLLRGELEGLGLDDVELTDQGYVFATLPGEGPTVGLIAHVDVSPDAPGAGVSPQVHENYQGGELVAGLSPATSTLLAERIGHDIVTS